MTSQKRGNDEEGCTTVRNERYIYWKSVVFLNLMNDDHSELHKLFTVMKDKSIRFARGRGPLTAVEIAE